ncbi:MAG: TIGR01212 family radical SAM protein [Planctomycetaceae bacterium]|nr:TIGR01212 family radical SAM protein [Planctomycetaceae bacterium]
MSDWQTLGYRYYPPGLAFRQEFGCPVWKVSVDAGFSCPNRDGTSGTGGCVFCDNASFAPSRRLCSGVSIREQINFGTAQLKRRYPKAEKFIAYFQPATNTYAPIQKLEHLYRSALEHPDTAGLAIGTRPDTLPDDVLNLLAELAQTTWVQLEIGLQSVHKKSLDFLQRGHSYEAFLDAVRRFSILRSGCTAGSRLRLGVHLILGLPDESREDALTTAEELAKLPVDSIKLHHLYVVRNTKLAEHWKHGGIILPVLNEYASLAVDFLERTPPNVVIERLAGEADAEFLLAPDWTKSKHAVRNAVDAEFRRRNSWQGKCR